MTPDVNLLLAAARSDHPHHAQAHRWLIQAAADAASGDGTLVLQPMVLASVLRLVTSAKVFQQPTPIDQAVAWLDAVLALPGVGLGTQGAEWPQLRALCLAKSLVGNDLPDAWLSATVQQQGEHLATFDRDFRRLLARHQLTVLDPAAA